MGISLDELRTKLAKFLFSLGRINKAKSGQGILIYNPKPFDTNELESLASNAGYRVIYNDQPTFYNGKQVPPKLYIGKISGGMEVEDTAAYLESL